MAVAQPATINPSLLCDLIRSLIIISPPWPVNYWVLYMTSPSEFPWTSLLRSGTLFARRIPKVTSIASARG
jgi:hypothetical protein